MTTGEAAVLLTQMGAAYETMIEGLRAWKADGQGDQVGGVYRGKISDDDLKSHERIREAYRVAADTLLRLQPTRERHPYDDIGSEFLPESCMHFSRVQSICRVCALNAIRRLVPIEIPTCSDCGAPRFLINDAGEVVRTPCLSEHRANHS